MRGGRWERRGPVLTAPASGTFVLLKQAICYDLSEAQRGAAHSGYVLAGHQWRDPFCQKFSAPVDSSTIIVFGGSWWLCEGGRCYVGCLGIRGRRWLRFAVCLVDIAGEDIRWVARKKSIV